MASHYCIGCCRRHSSHNWYSLSGSGCDAVSGRWCGTVYMRLNRMGGCLHPIWLELHCRIRHVDTTGRVVSIAAQRADLEGLAGVDALCRGVRSWSSLSHRLMAIGLVFQAYWGHAMTMLASAMLMLDPRSLSGRQLGAIWMGVSRRLRGCRYVGGILRCTVHGAHPMKNPSERQSGSRRFRALARSLGAWRVAAAQVAAAIGHRRVVAIRQLLSALNSDGLAVYTSRVCYGNVRLVRAIIVALELRVDDTPDDWLVLSRMSPHVTRLCRRWCLDHAAALILRDALRSELAYPSYSFLDLSCFLCLAGL